MFPLDELVKVTGVKEVWVFWLRLLPSPPKPRCEAEDGWLW